jgi:L-threonylcarbamoyladenylate synthase
MAHSTTIGTSIDEAKRLLAAGEVVGIPTETVYGLAGNALNPDAVLKIFEAKQRPHFDPLIVHVHSIAEVGKYATDIPAKAQQLMQRFMPGPLTVLLKKQSIIPDLVTSGLDSVAIRVPQHTLALQLLQQLDFPLAAPSANPFGYISPTTAQHVYDQLQHTIPYVLDGGATTVGVESTIVGFEGDDVIVYRVGGLAVEAIEAVVGKVHINTNESSNPKTPGALKSHYAPKKPLLFGDEAQLPTDKKIAVIAFDTYLTRIPHTQQTLLSPTGDLNEAAKNLFAAMRTLDNGDADVIYAIRFPNEGLGRAINDRLKRAGA